MNESEIKNGIKLLCETSSQVKEFYDRPDTLIDALNKVPISELKKCMDYNTSNEIMNEPYGAVSFITRRD